MARPLKNLTHLTHRVTVRMTDEEKAKLEEDAQLAGLTLSELIRRRYFGRPIIAQADLAVVRELRRLGGLLKHIHTESNGAYSKITADTLTTISKYISKLSSGDNS